MVGDRGRERLACFQVRADVVQGGAEGARARCVLKELDRVSDRHSDLDEGRQLAREEDQVRGADVEEGRELAVDPAPDVSGRPHRHDAIAAIEQVPMNRVGGRAVDGALFQLSTWRIRPVCELGADAPSSDQIR